MMFWEGDPPPLGPRPPSSQDVPVFPPFSNLFFLRWRLFTGLGRLLFHSCHVVILLSAAFFVFYNRILHEVVPPLSVSSLMLVLKSCCAFPDLRGPFFPPRIFSFPRCFFFFPANFPRIAPDAEPFPFFLTFFSKGTPWRRAHFFSLQFFFSQPLRPFA